MKIHIPVYAGISAACKLFDVNEHQIHGWINEGKVRYVIFNPGKNAKKRIYVNDVLRLIEKDLCGGECIPKAEK